MDTWLDPCAILIVPAVMAGANLWRRRREGRKRLLLATAPLLILCVLLIPALGLLALGSLEWRWAPLARRPPEAEAIVVLSGSLMHAEGARIRAELGPSTLYRCLHAAELYRSGPRRPVLVSGGRLGGSAEAPTCAALMGEFLEELGVDPRDLILEESSGSTHASAVACRELLGARGLVRVALVTDATHMARAAACFRKQGVGVIPAPCHFRATGLPTGLRDFIPSSNTAQIWREVLHEWIGLACYRMQGRI